MKVVNVSGLDIEDEAGIESIARRFRVSAAAMRYRWPAGFEKHRDLGVGIGICAATLQALGLLDGMADLADLKQDSVGQAWPQPSFQKRTRLKRKMAGPHLKQLKLQGHRPEAAIHDQAERPTDVARMSS